MTYEYLCEACGHRWEAEQRISDDPLKQCPKCNAAAAKRQISMGGGFILKGGGWYSDLYSSTKPAESASDSSEAAESSSSSSSTESTSTASTSGSAPSGTTKKTSESKETPVKSNSTPKGSSSAD